MTTASDDFYCDSVFSGNVPVVVVEETANVLAFHHTRPFWRVHIVVVPKAHVPSLLEFLSGAVLELACGAGPERRKSAPTAAMAVTAAVSKNKLAYELASTYTWVRRYSPKSCSGWRCAAWLLVPSSRSARPWVSCAC